MKSKIIMLMLFTVSILNAAPEPIKKSSYTDFYDKGNYMFSIIQEWQISKHTGEPTPLPMITKEYIYGENTGIALLFTKTDGKTVFNNSEWLKEAKWNEFIELNKIPVELYIQKNSTVIVSQEHEGEKYAWFLYPENSWCENNQNYCNPQAYNFAISDWRDELPCLDFDVWWCDSIGVGPIHDYFDEVYINKAITDVNNKNKLFVTQVDLAYGTVTTSFDSSVGTAAYINIQ